MRHVTASATDTRIPVTCWASRLVVWLDHRYVGAMRLRREQPSGLFVLQDLQPPFPIQGRKRPIPGGSKEGGGSSKGGSSAGSAAPPGWCLGRAGRGCLAICWCSAASNEASTAKRWAWLRLCIFVVIIGTRLSVWSPLHRPFPTSPCFLFHPTFCRLCSISYRYAPRSLLREPATPFAPLFGMNAGGVAAAAKQA